ncbi:hypothetical protein BDV41DRAFT_543301 [Aspergillus transmontanensis]|uniref:Uncharacterized protein n=1 Tax=Aspergillus transmontanensis TaxID=1034304 RepID=A0A5N6VS37_9EURO|nr:hypothetical protein BDV41DRAFT_543301 [Aspergillus transmontanensis]
MNALLHRRQLMITSLPWRMDIWLVIKSVSTGGMMGMHVFRVFNKKLNILTKWNCQHDRMGSLWTHYTC